MTVRWTVRAAADRARRRERMLPPLSVSLYKLFFYIIHLPASYLKSVFLQANVHIIRSFQATFLWKNSI